MSDKHAKKNNEGSIGIVPNLLEYCPDKSSNKMFRRSKFNCNAHYTPQTPENTL